MHAPTPRFFLAVPGILFVTALAASLAIIAAFLSPKGRSVDFITRQWARAVAFLCGLRLKAFGAERVERDRPYVIVSNHQSHLDVITLFLSSPVPMRMLGKKNLFHIPVFGWGMAMAGHIPIDRRHGKTDFEALKRASRSLLALGRSIMVFPEGLRSRDGALQPFKSGAFHIAKALDVPVVPVTIIGTKNILPSQTLRFRGGDARILWHDPVESRDLTADELSERVRRTIEISLRDRSK